VAVRTGLSLRSAGLSAIVNNFKTESLAIEVVLEVSDQLMPVQIETDVQNFSEVTDTNRQPPRHPLRTFFEEVQTDHCPEIKTILAYRRYEK